MTTSRQDRREGPGSNLPFKIPVLAATTTNITLSGEQTVDTVALVDGDRCLVKDQTDTTENGVYVVSTGAWTRALDFNDNLDVVRGTVVPVFNGGAWYELTSNVTSFSFGTTAITFGQINITQTGTQAAAAEAKANAAVGIAFLF